MSVYRSNKINYPVTVTSPKPSKQTTLVPDTARLRATLQDLTDAVRDLSTEEALSLEIEKLCNATLAIDEAFHTIGKKLSNATQQQSKRADVYDVCYALELQWNEHHLTYQSLIWRSREFAGEAQAAVDDFRELILPSLSDPDMTQPEKQKIIQEQIQVLQDASQPSQKLCQEFLDFGRTLDKYIAYFSQVVDSFGISDQSKKVTELGDRLRNARAAMESISKEVKGLGWKFAVDVAVTGVSILLAFVVPATWAKLLDTATVGIDCVYIKNTGLQLLEMRRRNDMAVAEYEAIRAEYELERACLGQMTKLDSTLHDAGPLVQEVTAKLGIFANVWAAITADIRKLKNSLHHAEDPTSKLFIRRIQRLEKMYGYLSQALRHYQVTVRSN